MKIFYSLLFILISPVLFAQDNTSDSTTTDEIAPKTSTTLPSLVLKNIEGEDVDIASFGTNGKLTIISFWATWCKPCIKELKNMNELMEDWAEEYDVEIIAVSVDDSRNMSKVRPFVSGMGWDFEVLLDPNGDLQRALNVANPPVTFLVDQNGNIVYVHTGYVEGDEYELEDHIIEITSTE